MPSLHTELSRRAGTPEGLPTDAPKIPTTKSPGINPGRIARLKQPHFEPLEARSLLSTYLYESQPDLFELVADSAAVQLLGTGAGGSVVNLGDVNADGVDDFAAGDNGYRIDGRGELFLNGKVLIYSGKGGVIRTLEDGHHGFGASLAAVSDLDGDGVKDLIVGNPGGNPADTGFRATIYAYSGKDGTLIRQKSSATDDPAFGQAIVTLGDTDGDGFDEILVTGNTTITSGQLVTIARWHSSDFSESWRVSEQGLPTAADDLNSDGVRDFYVERTTPGVSEHELWSYSGATGEPIRLVATFIGWFTEVSDVNADGANDLAFVNNNLPFSTPSTLTLVSPINSEELARVELGTITNDIGPISNIGDVDADGFDDVVLGLGLRNEPTRFAVHSGKTLAKLTETASNHGYFGVGPIVRAGDLNADGLSDYVFGEQFTGAFLESPIANLHRLDGMAVVTPVVAGFNSALDAWGTISGEAFFTINQKLVIAKTLPGFRAADRIVKVLTTGVVLGTAEAVDGGPFVRFTDGRRVEIDWVTDALHLYGPISAVDLSLDAGRAFVWRLVDGTPTAYLFDTSTGAATKLFEGKPVAMNTVATGFIGLAPNERDTILSDERGSSSAVPDFVGVAIRDDSKIVGIRTRQVGDVVTRVASIYAPNSAVPFDERFTDLPLVNDQWGFTPVLWKNEFILGKYTTDAPGDRWTVYKITTSAYDDVRGTWINGPSESLELTPMMLNAKGDIAGLYGGSAFALRVITETMGPAEAGDHGIGQTIEIGQTTYFGEPRAETATLAINDAGQLSVLAHLFPAGTGTPPSAFSWFKATIPGFSNSAAVNPPQAVLWAGPSAREFFVAATRLQGLSVIRGQIIVSYFGDVSVEWSPWQNISQDLGRPALVRSMSTLRLSATQTIIVGLDEHDDLAMYGQTGGKDAIGHDLWAYDNLTNSVLIPQNSPGAPPIVFNTDRDGDVITYGTPWGGLNIVGSYDGQPLAVWWAPGRNGWTLSNLFQAVDSPGWIGQRLTHLVANVLPWGGIGLTAGVTNFTDTALLGTIWWAPGLGGTWRYAEIGTAAQGDKPRGPSTTLTAFTTSWGAQNLLLTDDDGRLWVYWWSPQSNQWQSERLDIEVTAPHAGYTGRISALATTTGEMKIFVSDTTGHVQRFNWNRTTDAWEVSDASREF